MTRTLCVCVYKLQILIYKSFVPAKVLSHYFISVYYSSYWGLPYFFAQVSFQNELDSSGTTQVNTRSPICSAAVHKDFQKA